MKEIKEIISQNLISLRKERGLTQNELAEKLAYSDNMVSRWERGEITPSIETLQKISEFYNVSLSSLLEENSADNSAKEKSQEEKINNMKKFSIILSILTTVWFAITISFVYANAVLHQNIWKIFVLGVPLSCIVLLLFNGTWNKYIYRFVVSTVLLWSLLTFLYLNFLEYNLYLIFIVGVPVQLSLVIWAFIKPKKISHKK
ncbi:MAG: helix-turn-helix transcriptional regulator [Clostridia bacterium]|nr:helix-turn-helix transcriptional regulator [Clostridia bacterium]